MSSTPTHGKLIALWRQRPNGFKGSGLNDLTWGTGFSGAVSESFKVVIDGMGTPDTFAWSFDVAGAELFTPGASGVAITGAAQTLADGQTITFAATTGHTTNDQWAIGNLKSEGVTESGSQGQIITASRRVLNPNSPPTWTDSGGKTVVSVDYTRGLAVFNGAVGTVTVTGNNGFIPAVTMLEKMGFLIDWNAEFSVDMADASRAGQQWKEALPGQAGGRGGATAYFLGEKSFTAELLRAAAGTQKYVLLELFPWDPDQDITGDHFLVWAVINGIGVDAAINQVVKEKVTFEAIGFPSFVANV
jgi:hypothetical protein